MINVLKCVVRFQRVCLRSLAHVSGINGFAKRGAKEAEGAFAGNIGTTCFVCMLQITGSNSRDCAGDQGIGPADPYLPDSSPGPWLSLARIAFDVLGALFPSSIIWRYTFLVSRNGTRRREFTLSSFWY